MQLILDYFINVVNKLISILDTLKLPGSSSVLYYLLGAIIIGFIIRLVKGGSSEFEHSMNFSTGSIVNSKASSYKQKNDIRKAQIVKEKSYKTGFKYGMATANTTLDDSFNIYTKGKKEIGL